MSERRLVFLLLLSLAPNVWPQEPEFGRLFFTPERRAILDRLRLSNTLPGRDVVDDSSPLTLNGVLRRSNGRSAAWVNGVVLEEVAVKKEATVGFKTPTGNSQLQVGETINQANGDREDLLKGGSISVRRPIDKKTP